MHLVRSKISGDKEIDNVKVNSDTQILNAIV